MERPNRFATALIRLLSSNQFSVSLALTLVAVAVARLIHARGLTLDQVGVAYIAVATASLSFAGPASLSLVIAMAVLLGGGILALRTPVAGVAVQVVGAAVLSYSLPDRPLMQAAVLLFIPLAGLVVADFARRRPNLAGGLIAISVLGLFMTVPDTSGALVLLVATVLFVPGVLPAGSTAGPAAAPALVGLMIWVALEGGITRPGSVVGAIAGLGVLLIEPLLSRLLTRTKSWSLVSGPQTARLLIASQLVLVFLTSRVAGFQQRSEPALALSLLAWVVGGAFLIARRPSDRAVS